MNVAIWANKDSDYNRLNNHAILGGHFAPVRGGQFTPETRGSVCPGRRGSICPEFPYGKMLSNIMLNWIIKLWTHRIALTLKDTY